MLELAEAKTALAVKLVTPVPPSFTSRGADKLVIVALTKLALLKLAPLKPVLPLYLAPEIKIPLPAVTPEGKLVPIK